MQPCFSCCLWQRFLIFPSALCVDCADMCTCVPHNTQHPHIEVSKNGTQTFLPQRHRRLTAEDNVSQTSRWSLFATLLMECTSRKFSNLCMFSNKTGGQVVCAKLAELLCMDTTTVCRNAHSFSMSFQGLRWGHNVALFQIRPWLP